MYSTTALAAITWGETRKQAIREMVSVLTEVVRRRMKFGIELVPPAPAEPDETETLVIPAALKLRSSAALGVERLIGARPAQFLTA